MTPNFPSKSRVPGINSPVGERRKLVRALPTYHAIHATTNSEMMS